MIEEYPWCVYYTPPPAPPTRLLFRCKSVEAAEKAIKQSIEEPRGGTYFIRHKPPENE